MSVLYGNIDRLTIKESSMVSGPAATLWTKGSARLTPFCKGLWSEIRRPVIFRERMPASSVEICYLWDGLHESRPFEQSRAQPHNGHTNLGWSLHRELAPISD